MGEIYRAIAIELFGRARRMIEDEQLEAPVRADLSRHWRNLTLMYQHYERKTPYFEAHLNDWFWSQFWEIPAQGHGIGERVVGALEDYVTRMEALVYRPHRRFVTEVVAHFGLPGGELCLLMQPMYAVNDVHLLSDQKSAWIACIRYQIETLKRLVGTTDRSGNLARLEMLVDRFARVRYTQDFREFVAQEQVSKDMLLCLCLGRS